MGGKWNIWLLLAAGFMIGSAPVQAEHATTLVGLVNLTNYQAALLVITDTPPDAVFAMDTHKWVAEGEAFEDANISDKHLRIEISQIDFTNGVVRAKENNVNLLYVPQKTNSVLTTPGTSFRLNNADFDDALDFYAGAKGRTVLVHPDVKRTPLTISADVHSRVEAAGSIEKALLLRGTVMIADGDKFEWIVPAGSTASVLSNTIPAGPSARTQSATNSANTLPAGSINFINVDLRQVLEVYQALTAQKWVQVKPLPVGITFTFHNQTPLTKSETLHAFEVLFCWKGLQVVNANDKSFELVPVAAGK